MCRQPFNKLYHRFTNEFKQVSSHNRSTLSFHAVIGYFLYSQESSARPLSQVELQFLLPSESVTFRYSGGDCHLLNGVFSFLPVFFSQLNRGLILNHCAKCLAHSCGVIPLKRLKPACSTCTYSQAYNQAQLQVL